MYKKYIHIINTLLFIFFLILDLQLKEYFYNKNIYINKLFSFNFFCNKNISFSIPFNTYLLYIVNILIILLLSYLLLKYSKGDSYNLLCNKDKKEGKLRTNKFKILDSTSFNKTTLQLIKSTLITLIISGAIANLINRYNYQCVIDYIQIWKFPVFNLADILIVVSTTIWLYIEYIECKKSS